MALQQQPVECWDDDDLAFEGDLNFANSQSTAYKTSISLSACQSIRSESNAGDEDWQLPLNVGGDRQSTSQAIASASKAGIPLPTGVPASALIGGSIKRLGKKKSHRNLEEDWDNDVQFPDPGQGELKVKRFQRAPSLNLNDNDEFDDWAEGSLGIRTAGKHRESKNRDSSASAMSPSMGSCMTFESEEDGLDGLVIPTGPLDFQAALKRQEPKEETTDDAFGDQATEKAIDTKEKEDDFDDFDFGPGDVFDPKKRAVNRNIKQAFKTTHQSSPQTKPHTTITFTEKPISTRLPRPVHAPKQPSRLEPVFETGATNITRPRRSEAATTTGSQLLRSKRSMPALRGSQGLTKQPSVPSLPTHTNFTKPPARPHFHGRHGSDPNRSSSPVPRPSSFLRQPPDTPTRTNRRDVAPTSLAREAAAKRTITRPARQRNFGNGTELETFDDLPTSATKEKQFVKQPSSRAPPSSLRNQASQSRLGFRDKMTTPMPPATPKSPSRAVENLPRFARDTAASRIAREQKLGTSMNSLGVPVAKRSESVLATRTNWPAQVAARTPNTSPSAIRIPRKGPTLINPMGKENARHFQDDAARKGMHWNAHLLRWEGNEAAIKHFEPPSAIPSLQYANTHQPPNNPAPPSPPRPALITNMAAGAQPGIQVSGHMVFDPRQMRWLKMARGRAPSIASNPMSPSAGEATEEDDDPFKGIDDLKDQEMGGVAVGGEGVKGGSAAAGVAEGLKEEFDLGPVFIDRQKDEEAAWQARIGMWFPEDGAAQRDREGDRWKWAIRDIAAQVEM